MTVTLSAAGVALVVSLVAPFAIRPFLLRLNVIDIPSARSSHSVPTIRGAGLATLSGFIAGFFVLLMWGRTSDIGIVGIVLCSSVAAAGVGWVEDYRGISIKRRVAWQLFIGLSGTGVVAAVSGAPLWILPIGGIVVAGFINVANFMDGIDGISGFNGVVFGGMYAMVGLLSAQWWMFAAALVLAVVYLAFLPWNLGKESIFLGDSGSYLLGGAVSVIAIGALCAGVSAIMIVGPIAIYLADASFTLLSRILGGKRWYESHRNHVYHQLEDLGIPHVRVAAVVAGANCLTGGLSVLAANVGFWSALLYIVIAAAVVVAYLASPRIVRRLSGHGVNGAVGGSREHG